MKALKVVGTIGRFALAGALIVWHFVMSIIGALILDNAFYNINIMENVSFLYVLLVFLRVLCVKFMNRDSLYFIIVPKS